MAEVFATMFQDEALVVKSLIESTGIAAEISSEHFIDVYPIFFPQGGGIKIVVSEEDEEDARAVVAQYREPRAERRSSAKRLAQRGGPRSSRAERSANSSIADSMSSSIRARRLRPLASQRRGNMLRAVKPGIVFTSLATGLPVVAEEHVDPGHAAHAEGPQASRASFLQASASRWLELGRRDDLAPSSSRYLAS